ncbi:MAG: sigma-70 family RNA polymerase sigma factor [Candidatus Binatia bacterium]
MMRITELSRNESVVRFRFEGRLTDTTSGEFDAALQPCLAAGMTPLVDLAGVTFADAAAVTHLRDLRRQGALLSACSGFLSEMLRTEPVEVPQARPVRAALGGEAQLLERLRAGEDAAFAELLAAYGGRLLAVAQRMLRNEDDGRDALQDAMLSAFRSIGSFHGGSKLSTWLHRIVVNAALMRLRSRRQRAEQPIDELLPRFAADGHWADELGRPAAASDELLEQRETRAVVRRCIDRLPESYRTVLLMRDIEDLDNGEVAELLGLTPNAVKIRLHRARQALRTLLDEALQGEVGERAAADSAPAR